MWSCLAGVQEFCLFAVVGLLTDFYLQMFFFTTVLSIDIRRMEVRVRRKVRVQLHATLSAVVRVRLYGSKT